MRTAEFIAVAGTVASIAYYAICLWGALSFLRQQRARLQPSIVFPPVSILKPLRGIDPGMYESFRSHTLQDYPEYEIIFGVSDPDDPAINLVHRLQAEFPQRGIRLIVCRQRLGANIKVSNLVQMLPHVRHEFLVVNDSDLRVPQNYLRQATGPLMDPAVGLVTCLYRGVASTTLGSHLESLGIATDFCAGVLAARQLEGIKFGLGSTLSFRRRDLVSIGGFEAIADHLADDYEIGSRLAKMGLKVVLGSNVVESFLPAYSLRQFLEHQLRWARTLRSARPWGYLGLALTFGLPWALLLLAFSRGALWAWSLFVAALATRSAVALVVGYRTLGDGQVASDWWLLPMRDIIALAVWIASFAGRQVAWRGDLFTLRNGKLIRD